ncbi:hypothetical protein BJX61DRAFT_424955 [Aspergillus egyptiacus]|nr:hypothetical protein BJX61DRAFT_424955 [Aspergillus egyptiacus]
MNKPRNRCNVPSASHPTMATEHTFNDTFRVRSPRHRYSGQFSSACSLQPLKAFDLLTPKPRLDETYNCNLNRYHWHSSPNVSWAVNYVPQCVAGHPSGGLRPDPALKGESGENSITAPSSQVLHKLRLTLLILRFPMLVTLFNGADDCGRPNSGAEATACSRHQLRQEYTH